MSTLASYIIYTVAKDGSERYFALYRDGTYLWIQRKDQATTFATVAAAHSRAEKLDLIREGYGVREVESS